MTAFRYPILPWYQPVIRWTTITQTGNGKATSSLSGYVIEGEALRKMTDEEKIIAGSIPPPAGMKVEEGAIIPQTLEDKKAAGVLAEADYLALKTTQAQAELNGRLAVLSTEEAKAMAEVDQEYAAQRKAKIAALLAVKQQPGWPLDIPWPEEQ
jgi:hypothetical protein